MKGLIQKSGYIKPGNGGGHYAEYIATRELPFRFSLLKYI